MGIKIHGHMFKPVESKPLCMTWRVYGTKQTFTFSDGRLGATPATWEFVTEFKLKSSRGKFGFPTFELEPTDAAAGWKFYNLVPLDAEGKEIWHKDNEITLPHDLPEEFGGSLDVGAWLLWNMEEKGIIALGQLHD
jgi:hypothetical protein